MNNKTTSLDMVKVNLITGKLGDGALQQTSFLPEEFWRTYLILLSTRKGSVVLTEKQIALAVYLLTADTGVSHFEGPARKKMCKDLTLSSPEVNKIANELLRQGILAKPKDGRTRGKWFLSDNLRTFRNFVERTSHVEFTFPMTLKQQDNEQ